METHWRWRVLMRDTSATLRANAIDSWRSVLHSIRLLCVRPSVTLQETVVAFLNPVGRHQDGREVRAITQHLSITKNHHLEPSQTNKVQYLKYEYQSSADDTAPSSLSSQHPAFPTHHRRDACGLLIVDMIARSVIRSRVPLILTSGARGAVARSFSGQLHTVQATGLGASSTSSSDGGLHTTTNTTTSAANHPGGSWDVEHYHRSQQLRHLHPLQNRRSEVSCRLWRHVPVVVVLFVK